MLCSAGTGSTPDIQCTLADKHLYLNTQKGYNSANKMTDERCSWWRGAGDKPTRRVLNTSAVITESLGLLFAQQQHLARASWLALCWSCHLEQTQHSAHRKAWSQRGPSSHSDANEWHNVSICSGSPLKVPKPYLKVMRFESAWTHHPLCRCSEKCAPSINAQTVLFVYSPSDE